MLIIRNEQMEVLSKYMLKQFEDRMVTRLRSKFPDQTEVLMERELRNLIHSGIEKAEKYNVTIEYDVQRFLEYMFTFGAEFDSSPETAWAEGIFRADNINGPTKMDQLEEYVRNTLGDLT